ncbi:MAG: cobalamin-dependent protein, partial [Planctomycetes bacterium]|nr:cobalamin-dependent protein [Planctomycetota bacterium]
MNVVLIQPRIDGSIASVTPPVGLAYLAAALTQIAVPVACIAADVENLTDNETAERALSLKPIMIGISTTTLSVYNAIAILRRVKACNPTVVGIAGGPHATIFPEELLTAGFDFVVRGEGEDTI